MTYNEFIKLPISEKIVLFELIKGSLVENVHWIKEAPGVWKCTYSWESGKAVSTTKWGVGTWGAGTWGVTSNTNLPTCDNSNITTVGSLSVGTTQYLLVPTITLCQTTNESFYWDTTKQVLYINYSGIIKSQFVTLGITKGYANKDIYIEGIFYEGRLIKAPKISIKRDKLFNNKVTYEGGNLLLENINGELNSFRTDDVYGWPIKIYYGSPDLIRDEYRLLYTGYFEKWNKTGNNMSISIKDERGNLKRKIPNNFLEQTTYTNLKDGNVGKAIPIAYGVINNGIAYCTNEEETTPATWEFLFVDTSIHTIHSISQVYVDGLEVSYSSGSIANGTFELSTGDYDKGQKVTVSYSGYVDGSSNLIDNPMDITVDILDEYEDIDYTSIYYNTTDWDAAAINLPEVGVLVTKPTEIMKVLGELSSPISGTFLNERDGRFSMKKVDLAGNIKRKIKWNRYPEGLNPVEKNLDDEYISTARVGYGKDWFNKDWAYSIDNSEETSLYNRFHSLNDKDFNTLLTNESDAASYAEDMMNLFGGIFTEYTFTTTGMQDSDLEIEDVISVEVFKYSDGSIDTVIAEITGITLDLINHRVTITCRTIDREADDQAGVYGISIYGISIFGS